MTNQQYVEKFWVKKVHDGYERQYGQYSISVLAFLGIVVLFIIGVTGNARINGQLLWIVLLIVDLVFGIPLVVFFLKDYLSIL